MLVGIVAACAAGGTAAREAGRAGGGEDAAARRLMASVEKRQRNARLAFSMDIEVTTGGESAERRRILAVARGDPDATHLVYVVTLPSFDRGSTLLIEDRVASRAQDHMWLWLPGLMSFREIEARSLRAPVPGTGLTYENARGWISADMYRFRTLEQGADEVTIEARPRSDSLAENLGVSKLIVRVEPRLSVVTGVVSYDEAGNVARTYEASDFVEVAGHWFPGRVATHHYARRIEGSITYRYHALAKSPPLELFRPRSDGDAFLSRILAWRASVGLAEEIPDTLTPR